MRPGCALTSILRGSTGKEMVRKERKRTAEKVLEAGVVRINNDTDLALLKAAIPGER